MEVLVRAHHDRCLAKGAPKLFAAMRAGAADGHVEIEVDRLSARRKSSGRQARPARTGRVARAEVRHRQVVAPPSLAGAEPVALSTVHVRETAPPPGEPAVEWFLLTSLDVDSTETAVAVIGYYLRRWRIEDLFRVPQVRMPSRTSRVPHRRPAPTRGHHPDRDRLAPDGDDPARS